MRSIILKSISFIVLLAFAYSVITKRVIVWEKNHARENFVQEEPDDAITYGYDIGKTKQIPITSPDKDSVSIKVGATSSEKEVDLRPKQQQAIYTPIVSKTSDTILEYRPPVSPCIQPITYTIGSVDPRFSLTQEALDASVQEAATLWNSLYTRPLFKQGSGTRAVTINLVYDDRQANTEKRNYLLMDIDNAKHTATLAQTTLTEEKSSHATRNATFIQNQEDFKKRLEEHNAVVASYNISGGAPQDIYTKLLEEERTLAEKKKLLEQERDALVLEVSAINEHVTKYNTLVSYINDLIAEVNTLGGKTFTEGRFNPNTMTIEIFEYSDEVKLLRVIAHELGHALGVNHVPNKDSIMYEINAATTTSLSREDAQALTDICSSY